MLNANEVKLLKILNDNANKQSVTLLSISAILIFLNNQKLNKNYVKKTLILLMQNDYLDVTFIEKNAEEFCLITIKSKGKNYKIEKESVARQFFVKILFALCGAVVSFIVGKLLYLFFS